MIMMKGVLGSPERVCSSSYICRKSRVGVDDAHVIYCLGENGSSRESLANLLDEGLGTSLDGTDEISSSIHPTLGRNDSGKSNRFILFFLYPII